MSNTKEIKNFLEKMFKNSAKSYGYKVISGIPYKEINGALFDIILQTSTSKDGVQMRCSLHYKPLYCDYALWAVMGVDDEMSRQPFSIHSNGAFVALIFNSRNNSGLFHIAQRPEYAGIAVYLRFDGGLGVVGSGVGFGYINQHLPPIL